MSAARRTCIACRVEGDRDELVRIVLAPDGSPVLDYRARLPGRGAWVHPRSECVDAVEARPQLLARAFKGRVPSFPLRAQLHEAILAAALDGLSLASAAGALIGGHDLLEQALRDRRVTAVVTASDASERTIESLRRAASQDVSFVPLPLDRADLGHRVGRGSRAALGITPSRAAAHLRRQLRRMRELG